MIRKTFVSNRITDFFISKTPNQFCHIRSMDTPLQEALHYHRIRKFLQLRVLDIVQLLILRNQHSVQLLIWVTTILPLEIICCQWLYHKLLYQLLYHNQKLRNFEFYRAIQLFIFTNKLTKSCLKNNEGKSSSNSGGHVISFKQFFRGLTSVTNVKFSTKYGDKLTSAACKMMNCPGWSLLPDKKIFCSNFGEVHPYRRSFTRRVNMLSLEFEILNLIKRRFLQNHTKVSSLILIFSKLNDTNHLKWFIFDKSINYSRLRCEGMGEKNLVVFGANIVVSFGLGESPC